MFVGCDWDVGDAGWVTSAEGDLVIWFPKIFALGTGFVGDEVGQGSPLNVGGIDFDQSVFGPGRDDVAKVVVLGRVAAEEWV